MTREHFLLLAKFLDDLGDRMGNAGCNDFDMKKYGLPLSDRNDLVRDFHAYNGDPGETVMWTEEYDALHSHDYRLPDFCVVGLLAHLCTKEAEDA